MHCNPKSAGVLYTDMGHLAWCSRARNLVGNFGERVPLLAPCIIHPMKCKFYFWHSKAVSIFDIAKVTVESEIIILTIDFCNFISNLEFISNLKCATNNFYVGLPTKIFFSITNLEAIKMIMCIDYIKVRHSHYWLRFWNGFINSHND